MRFDDLTGKRFGKLTIIKRLESSKSGHSSMWQCKCDCGTITKVSRNNLMNGHTKSCGCLKHESRVRTHGKSKNRLYYVWRDMLNRCFNESVPDYHSYGGRGITVCDEWKDDFQSFYDWAMENGYDETAKRGAFTLDRIDVEKDYEPSNCRWVDVKLQQNNRRNNVIIEYDGCSYTLAQLSELTGIPYKTLHKRIRVLNWDIEKAIKQ